MNKCKSGRKLFRKKSIRDLLPMTPVKINIEKWWLVKIGLVTEDDIKVISSNEKELIDKIIDLEEQKVYKAADTDLMLLQKLYKQVFFYLFICFFITLCPYLDE